MNEWMDRINLRQMAKIVMRLGEDSRKRSTEEERKGLARRQWGPEEKVRLISITNSSISLHQL